VKCGYCGTSLKSVPAFDFTQAVSLVDEARHDPGSR
jgi:hypothetical protein